MKIQKQYPNKNYEYKYSLCVKFRTIYMNKGVEGFR